jgi:hypothetical protein
MQGYSLERQTQAAVEYAERHGLELDEELTFRDLGVRAFDGTNANRGRLADFRFAVQRGEVAPGSFLLIESFDRLSRMDPWEALPIFQEIINANITVVTLQDGKVWSREGIRGNPWSILESLIVMMRAHEESLTKARRLSDAYERKRSAASTNGTTEGPFTRMLPAWLYWDEEAKDIKAIPERAEIVRMIFEKAAAGWGQHSIAHWLNQQGVDTWGRRIRKATHWHRSYIKKILSNRAVVGTFTPHTTTRDSRGVRRRSPGAPIDNYFPPVVSRDLFEQVASSIAAVAPRGRHSNGTVRSVFAGLLKCDRCGSTVTRVSKGKHVYLVCTRANAKASGCEYRSVPYGQAEGALRRSADIIIELAPRGRNTAEIQDQIERLDVLTDVLVDQARDLADEYMSAKSSALRRRLREKEAELERAMDDLRSLRERRDALTTTMVALRLSTMHEALKQEPFNVKAANAALKQAIKKMVMHPEDGRLDIHWHHSEEPQDVMFHTKRFLWDREP